MIVEVIFYDGDSDFTHDGNAGFTNHRLQFQALNHLVW